MARVRSYRELHEIHSHRERFQYLQVHARIGVATFGFERYLNQRFYTSREWRHARNAVIARDRGCDLGIEGYEVYDKIIVHHMNPLNPDDITEGHPRIFDPEYLICVTQITHNAVHYGDESLLAKPPVERRPGDTKLW